MNKVNRTKPKRLYFSVDEDVYEKFKKYCKINNTTIQYELSSLFDTLWTNIEMNENLDFSEGGEI